jgi:hypothetical protein
MRAHLGEQSTSEAISEYCTILCFTETLSFLTLLHAIFLEPDGIDVDEARYIADILLA